MGRIPVRFKRMAEAFNVAARGRLCESSGSEHSPENSMDLSDLVDSFIENENRGDGENEGGDVERERDLAECERMSSDLELKQTLSHLFGCDEDDELKRNVVSETEEAYRVVGNDSSPGFKRRLMTRLRERGFDAGLCKSKWDKNGRIPSGSYEYIDVNISGTRYIIEVYLAGQFEIARPTDGYSSLLQVFPLIFVGKLEKLKKIVRLMCNAIKHSMKNTEMALPPWRRFGYMQAKWFDSYKRTVNEVLVKKDSYSDEDLARKRSVGFVPLPAISYYCRGDFVSKVGLKMGQLAMEMNGNNMLL